MAVRIDSQVVFIFERVLFFMPLGVRVPNLDLLHTPPTVLIQLGQTSGGGNVNGYFILKNFKEAN